MTSESCYYLCRNADGEFLSGRGGSLGVSSLANDACMWRVADQQLHCADSDLALDLMSDPALNFEEESCQLRNVSGTLVLQPGPSRLPSEHLAELQAEGFTVMERALDAPAISRFKAQAVGKRASGHADETSNDGFFSMMGGLSWSPELCHGVTHPVVLWLMQQYMSTEHIHFGHQPVISTLKPADTLRGTNPELYWHSDYPYHPGVFPDDDWPQTPIFGVQFNICIDAFEAVNAATQFVPGSHVLSKGPPIEFNEGGTRMGEGVHKNVQQFIAPAGAALIYDSRTWHRACYELNLSGKDRMAVLNAVTPSWVRPMMDKKPVSEWYANSDVPAALTKRKRRDITRLCNSSILPTPEDMPKLSQRLK